MQQHFHNERRAHKLGNNGDKAFWGPLPDAPASIRFIVWQVQLDLISPDPETWDMTWATFCDTYTALTSTTGADNHLTNSVHGDVVRLSRYSPHLDAADFQRLERILCIFALCSSSCGYQQGWHELLVPLYISALRGGRELNMTDGEIEAIAYFMLHSLINGTFVGDLYMPHSESLNKLCSQAFHLLKASDGRLHADMEAAGVIPTLCAFSWASALFAQTYELKQLLHLWDFLFHDVAKISETLCHLIAAHFVTLRNRLVGKNFPAMMTVFKNLEFASVTEPVRLCRRSMF
jgi:hypothetical protein